MSTSLENIQTYENQEIVSKKEVYSEIKQSETEKDETRDKEDQDENDNKEDREISQLFKSNSFKEDKVVQESQEDQQNNSNIEQKELDENQISTQQMTYFDKVQIKLKKRQQQDNLLNSASDSNIVKIKGIKFPKDNRKVQTHNDLSKLQKNQDQVKSPTQLA